MAWEKVIMSRTLIITVAIIVGLLALFCLFIVLKPTQYGNVAKFDRTFTAQETALLESRVISEAELKAADGKDGNPAYIAIQGIVYDVGSLPSWKGGEHHKLYAGAELSDKFLKSGHGVAYLQKLPVVGRLEKTATKQLSPSSH